MNAPQPVHFAVDYPDRALDRLTTAFRLVVAIPILVVLAVLILAAVGRWNNRVVAYALILVTDQYPPFRLRP